MIFFSVFWSWARFLRKKNIFKNYFKFINILNFKNKLKFKKTSKYFSCWENRALLAYIHDLFNTLSCNHSTIFHSDCSLSLSHTKIIIMILNFIYRCARMKRKIKCFFRDVVVRSLSWNSSHYAVQRCQRFLWLQFLGFHVINLAHFF